MLKAKFLKNPKFVYKDLHMRIIVNVPKKTSRLGVIWIKHASLMWDPFSMQVESRLVMFFFSHNLDMEIS